MIEKTLLAVVAGSSIAAPMFRGLLDALPIVFAYAPYGLASGMLSRQTGLSLPETLGMCLVLYAGTSQIIALGLIQAGQGFAAIVFTTLCLNIRFALMSMALAPFLARWPLSQRLLFGYHIADEPFALFSVRFAQTLPTPVYAFSVHLTAYVAWAAWNALGFVASGWIPDLRTFGVDFAVVAVFIGLLTYVTRDRRMVVVAIGAAALALLLRARGATGSAIIIASIGAAGCGALWDLWRNEKSIS